jgi:hypothetical protein
VGQEPRPALPEASPSWRPRRLGAIESEEKDGAEEPKVSSLVYSEALLNLTINN